MECSVIDERYMNMGTNGQALETILKYKKRCQMFDGDFTLLWHNSRFFDMKEVELYKNIISLT